MPYWGKNCEQICECGIGSSTCDPSRGCICDSGWQGSNCSIDIDECTVNPGICQSDQLCENLDGSYQCNCQTGFEKSGSNCQSKTYFYKMCSTLKHRYILSKKTNVTEPDDKKPFESV